MSAKHDLICKRLRDEGDKLLTLFEALTPDRWQTVIYTDGMKWSIKDVLAHQVSAERKLQFYGQDILNGGEGAPAGFVVNEFNNAEVAGLSDRSVAELLADLRSVRQTTIDLARTIAEAEFARCGRHPVFGLISMEEMFKLIYRHNMLHARDIRKATGGTNHDTE
jgi:uncharacterized protein (TIGR03083 family)